MAMDVVLGRAAGTKVSFSILGENDNVYQQEGFPALRQGNW